MSTQSIPSRPTLHPDVSWLLAMPPDLDNLNAYLNPPSALPEYAPPGAHSQPFTISNIFLSPSTAPPEVAKYDRSPLTSPAGPDGAHRRGGAHYALVDSLASARDDDLLFMDVPPAMPADKPLEDWVDDWLASMSETDGALSADLDELSPDEREDFRRWALTASTQSRVNAEQYNDLLLRFLVDLVSAWQSALWWYHNPLEQTPPHPDWEHWHWLRVTPYVAPLPEEMLIRHLHVNYMTKHLILLTARHELGHIVETVRAWHRAVCTNRLAPGDEGLTSHQLGLLAARRRGHAYYVGAPVDDSSLRRRNDRPHLAVITESDLARLYWLVEEWYIDLYYATTDMRRCKRPGCANILPPRQPGRRPPEYCSEACKLAARRDTFRRSQQNRTRTAAEKRDQAFRASLAQAQSQRARR